MLYRIYVFVSLFVCHFSLRCGGYVTFCFSLSVVSAGRTSSDQQMVRILSDAAKTVRANARLLLVADSKKWRDACANTDFGKFHLIYG